MDSEVKKTVEDNESKMQWGIATETSEFSHEIHRECGQENQPLLVYYVHGGGFWSIHDHLGKSFWSSNGSMKMFQLRKAGHIT